MGTVHHSDPRRTMTDQTSTELNAAGVPHDALARLAELKPGKPGSIFTSDLSVNEFLLVREAGVRPPPPARGPPPPPPRARRHRGHWGGARPPPPPGAPPPP